MFYVSKRTKFFDNQDIIPKAEKSLLSQCENCFTRVIACFLSISILPIHIFIVYYFWCNDKKSVNKQLCSCSCWDSVFKGPYESGTASFKHVYFNSTSNSFKIWALSVFCILLLYESLRRLVRLVLLKRARFSMILLFISSLFPHYYSWWMFFNYWNDEYYIQWYHQMFFSLTEGISSALVLLLADIHVNFSAHIVLVITSIASFHILISSFDQFVSNVLQGEGYSFQIVRDLGFMIPDILHLLIPFYILKKQNHSRQLSSKHYAMFAFILLTGIIAASLL